MNEMKNFILDKAKERAQRFGYKKTTMNEISSDCRISKRRIYQNFADKKDMFRCLIIRESQQTTQMLFSQIENISDPTEKLIQLIRISVSYFNQENIISRVLKEDGVFSLLDFGRYREIIDEEIISLIAEIIRDGKIKGAFREIDEKITAYAGYKLFQAFTIGRTGILQQQDEEYSTEVLIDYILNGILKR